MRLCVPLCALCATFITVFDLYGQVANPAHTALKQRFESPEAVQWVRSFKGAWQNMHPIMVVLAFDGAAYEGTMYHASGNVLFDLVGYAQEGQIRMQEIDQSGRTSGYLIVEIVEGLMTGQWWSVDFSRAASILLRDETLVELRRFEPDILRFNGLVDEASIALIVQREESDLLSGFCMREGEEALYRLTGSCTDDVCEKMHFQMTAPSGEIKTLECTLARNASCRFQISNDPGEIQVGTGSLLNRYPMRRMDLAGYIGNIDCIYPELSVPAFDLWIKSQVESWYHRMRSYLDSLEEVYIVPGPDERWSVQASAWIDLTLITLEKISGIMTMYNPVDTTYDRMAFIFDTRSGKLQDVQNLGRKSDFRNVLQADAGRVKETPLDNEGYLDWLEALTFHHITITSAGFVLFTDFHPVFGDAWVMLRFEDYTNAMKRNAFVHDLMLNKID